MGVLSGIKCEVIPSEKEKKKNRDRTSRTPCSRRHEESQEVRYLFFTSCYIIPLCPLSILAQILL